MWALMDEDATEMNALLCITDPKQWIFHILDNIPEEDSTKILVLC